MGSRRLSRWAVPFFLLAFATTLAELSWWTVFNLRNVRASCVAKQAALYRDATLCRRLLATGNVDATALQASFLDLTVAGVDAVIPRPEALAALQRQARAHTRMFVAEGSFFAATMVAGLALILRALRHEVGVVRQEQNFVAAVTHELKSPLASIRLWAETLSKRTFEPADRRRYLGFILGDLDRLDGLVGNVLAAARLEALPGGRRTRRASRQALAAIDLGQATLQVARQLAPHLQAKGIDVRLKLAQGCYGKISPEAWALVVRNLLDNASKHSPEGGKVDIFLRAGERAVTLEVVDFGTGLAPRELTAIFAKFYRVGNEMVRGSQGTGLGLYLVQQILWDFGGTVTATSAGLGQGATFAVRLPSAAGAAAFASAAFGEQPGEQPRDGGRYG